MIDWLKAQIDWSYYQHFIDWLEGGNYASPEWLGLFPIIVGIYIYKFKMTPAKPKKKKMAKKASAFK